MVRLPTSQPHAPANDYAITVCLIFDLCETERVWNMRKQF